MSALPARPGLIALEVSGASASIFITHGTVNLWFGRSADHNLVAMVLKVIARVDSAAEHEKVITCLFEEIGQLEGNGYILTSYSRQGDRYRAIFVVPFSKERALNLFVDNVVEELGQGDLHLSLRWRGGSARMRALSRELERVKYFTTFQPTYKEQS
ncbi:MAG: hypothetical protein A4E45_01953 [Methanosaeta sp. PtaB.Bin039]|nr:MAG: hypothetical protein A4E45_01953 [Methanosaeta sp. PtaB.Bin039]HOT07675.1 hypothetical protein [Methanotrichaceae archaeon]HQF17524.1 hypothetical protein [Methanotrichaceae archaeon]HQI92071.1 hypothetical protein [Methanotrichaceae archaeon]HQJ29310.1 hypothetical protein [Methanotrichaceae archaeon]